MAVLRLAHPAPAAAERWQVALSWAACTLAACGFMMRSLREAASRADGVIPTDLQVYFDASQRLAHGAPVYELPARPFDFAYIYPPLLAELLLPFSTFAQAWWAWTAFSIACWLGSIAGLMWAYRQRLWWSLAPAWRPIVLVMWVMFPPVLFHLRFGQVNLFMLALLVASWLYLRAGATIASGIWLGLAIVVKLVAGPVCLPLLGSRRVWLVGVALAAALFVAAASFVPLGLDDVRTYVNDVLPAAYVTVAPENRSLGMSLQMFVGPDSAPLWLRSAASMTMGAIAVCVAWQARPRADQALALGATTVLLTTPVVWLNTYPLAYLPYVQAFAESSRQGRVLVSLSYVVLGMTGYVLATPGDSLFMIAVKHSVPNVALLVLFGVQCALLLRSHPN